MGLVESSQCHDSSIYLENVLRGSFFFLLKIYKNNIFIFLKFIFYINILKQITKNYKNTFQPRKQADFN